MPDTRLPFSWEECRLGDVVDYGATQKAEPDEIPDDAWVLELEDIEKDTSTVLQRVPFAQRQSKSTKNRFTAGDVLYGKLRPYLNKVVRADQDGYCTTEIVPLKPSEAIDSGYLFYWLKHPVFLEYVTSVSHGLNMPRLGTEAGKEAPFVLAPLSEQKRIADKLDTVLARVDACRERLDRMPAILKRFRQAVLTAATSGKLTEAWRALNDIERWQTVKLSEVAKSRLGKMLDKAKNQGAATPYLRNINVRWFGFDLSDIQTIRVTEDEARDLAVQKSDVLICEGGEPGRCAVWRGEDSAYVYQKALHRVRVGPALTPEWLCYSLKNAADSGRLTDLFTGTTIKHLTGVALGQFELPLPPLREQHEIIRRVETLFAYADRFETRYTAARAQVDRLTPALLAKAFRGELVSQDSNDEPASMLLERIRASHAAAGEKPTRKVRTERKPMATTLTTDTLKEIIRGLPTDQFTFDDLRGHVATDYETLKAMVFALLSEAPASVKQVFDTEANTMRLVRVK